MVVWFLLLHLLINPRENFAGTNFIYGNFIFEKKTLKITKLELNKKDFIRNQFEIIQFMQKNFNYECYQINNSICTWWNNFFLLQQFRKTNLNLKRKSVFPKRRPPKKRCQPEKNANICALQQSFSTDKCKLCDWELSLKLNRWWNIAMRMKLWPLYVLQKWCIVQ